MGAGVWTEKGREGRKKEGQKTKPSSAEQNPILYKYKIIVWFLK